MKKKAKQVEDAPQYDDFGQLIIKATKLKPKSKKELAKINTNQKKDISEYFDLKKIKKTELEKFYKIKLSKEEFEVIKWRSIRGSNEFPEFYDGWPGNSRYKPFRECIFAVAHFDDGTERSKFNFNSPEEKYTYHNGLRSAIYADIENGYPSYRFDEQREIFDRSILKKENKIISKNTKEEIIEFKEEEPVHKENSKPSSFDPFFILRFIPDNAFGGFLVLLFLTWLIFSVILDIGPGSGPSRFFGHDGG